jgi:hypothetical protein
MIEIVVALVTAVGAVAVGYLEHGRRSSRRQWQKNTEDHNHVIDKIDSLGRSLGRSIDRVERAALRTEHKIDQHINDHVTGKVDRG